jgi:hypothetical protein
MKIPCAEIPKATDKVFFWLLKELLKLMIEQSKYQNFRLPDLP